MKSPLLACANKLPCKSARRHAQRLRASRWMCRCTPVRLRAVAAWGREQLLVETRVSVESEMLASLEQVGQ
eukprot:688326-Pleurochrysis_carterae.AAC.1